LELLGEEEEEEEEEGREQPKMGAYSVAEVIVYPVKACRGISVSSAAISATGNTNNYRCFHSPKKQSFFSTILQTVLDHHRPQAIVCCCCWRMILRWILLWVVFLFLGVRFLV
jgi:hypothetical protein